MGEVGEQKERKRKRKGKDIGKAIESCTPDGQVWYMFLMIANPNTTLLGVQFGEFHITEPILFN